MNVTTGVLAAAVGYLLGSLSFARLVTRVFAPDQEVTGVEYRVPGTDETVEVQAIHGTAVANRLGSKYGCLTALLDILKVALPALVFRLGYPGTRYFLIAAAMGVVGHNWPVYHRFKGGRGISAIYGGFLVVDWLGTLVTSVVASFLGLVVFKRVLVELSVLVAYAGGIVLMIPWIWFRTYDAAYLAYVVFVNAMFALATIPDIRMMRDVRRRGIEIDMATQMDATPMGRGLRKTEAWFKGLRGGSPRNR